MEVAKERTARKSPFACIKRDCHASLCVRMRTRTRTRAPLHVETRSYVPVRADSRALRACSAWHACSSVPIRLPSPRVRICTSAFKCESDCEHAENLFMLAHQLPGEKGRAFVRRTHAGLCFGNPG
eukprot:6192348-Pleurochrysis_carterae.AAC.1